MGLFLEMQESVWAACMSVLTHVVRDDGKTASGCLGTTVGVYLPGHTCCCYTPVAGTASAMHKSC